MSALVGSVQRISPLTGLVTTYVPTVQNHTVQHQTALPEVSTVINSINSSLLSSNVDAFCDSLVVVQGPLTDTLQPRVYISSQSPLAPAIVAIVMQILKIVFAALLVVGALYGLSALKELIYGVPNQYWLPGVTITGPVDWTTYISYQNAHFWYVCNKDGMGFGDRSLYPAIGDVPVAEVAAYTEHCASAPDLSPVDNITGIAILVAGTAIVIGGIYLAVKLLERPSVSAAVKRRVGRLI